MVRIMFICHGNICRSPLAEFVMKDLAARAGVSSGLRIASSAVSAEELGNPIYPPVRRLLKEHGIPFDPNRTARLFRSSEYDDWDLLIVMDHSNFRNLLRSCPDPEGKVHLLLDFTDRPGDVADPWYSGQFEQTWIDVSEGCAALLDRLMKEGRIPSASGRR